MENQPQPPAAAKQLAPAERDLIVLATGQVVGLVTANGKAAFRVKSFGDRCVVLEVVPTTRIVRGRLATEEEMAGLAGKGTGA